MRDSILREILNKDFIYKYYSLKYVRFDDLIPIKKQYKISICTNCMGRSEDIKRTLKKNIEDNINYPNLEFVLLNYNSKDDLDEYVKNNLMGYINKGVLNYYKTTDPSYYSMTHSRNVSFKIAQGDIVNNVDSDHFINKGFVEYINILANQDKKLVFVKSDQKNRGRLGMFKNDFISLGGYDENIEGYGHDDKDLLLRAYRSGFKLVKFGGKYFIEPAGHKRHPVDNYKNKDWKYTQRRNILISLLNIKYGKLIANRDKEWGVAKVIKNFSEELDTRNL